jgi:hypothetical protein
MPRELTPKQMAEKIQKWARIGWDYRLIRTFITGLETDRYDSRADAPKRRGNLAATIRVITPSSTRSAKYGGPRFSLSAGSTSRSNPVPYASVLQLGTVGYPPVATTKAHPIPFRDKATGRLAKAGQWIGVRSGGRWVGMMATGKALKTPFGIFRSVKHPGSKFRGIGFLKVDRPRLASYVQRELALRTQEAFDA